MLLHDHLDGGPRPGTVIDLARETGYGALPETRSSGLDGGGPARTWTAPGRSWIGGTSGGHLHRTAASQAGTSPYGAIPTLEILRAGP